MKVIRVLENIVLLGLPLYHQDFPIILFWTPKAGCTTLLKWFLYQLGLLEEAQQRLTVHVYRSWFQEKYFHVKELMNYLTSGSKHSIKLVRNPFQRAVSSFIDFVFVNLWNAEPEGSKRCKNWKYCQEKFPSHEPGISFKQFLYCIQQLKNMNPQSLDFHIDGQYMEGEEEFIKEYVKLEDFDVAFQKLEMDYRLLKSPISVLKKSLHHFSEYTSREGNFSEVVMTKKTMGIDYSFQGGPKALPTYRSFYDRETIDLVKNMFFKDFKNYQYDLNIHSTFK